ncbi:hypothetical protein LSTR_LSTR009984 [Laodelphax striatellus]|uniref:DUF4485 domain-containing protein n=1 Tax=Laodelphax striatellus TaxID=195883 RepID=A0A482WWJ2_LAOST|nr:hypothetical protein LSTR_LSTR009984 [Laodelphax striatellus]
MTAAENKEFMDAIFDIAEDALQLETAADRVRCCEWVRKLVSLPDDNLESAKMRNEYIQYLRIMVRFGFLHGIFLKSPPPGEMRPLAESLGVVISKSVPDLPSVGPIAPFLAQQSPDGRAYLSIKKIPERGIFCYMAVAPEIIFEEKERPKKQGVNSPNGH